MKETITINHTRAIKYILLSLFAVCLFLIGGMRVSAEENSYVLNVTVYDDVWGGSANYTTYWTVNSSCEIVAYVNTQYSDGSCSLSFTFVNSNYSYSASFESYVTTSGALYKEADNVTLINPFSFTSSYPSNLSVSCKVFDSKESATAYAQTGDDSGQINKPEVDDTPQSGTYDDTLSNISNLKISNLTSNDCHGEVDNFLNCFQLSWDVPSYDKSLYMDFFQFKFSFDYSYMNYYGSAKLKYGSALIDYKVNDTSLCVSVVEGKRDFCAHEFCELLGLENDLSLGDYISKFNINPLKKIYVQHVRVERASGSVSYGNWCVYDVDLSDGVLTFNQKETGDLNIYTGDTNIDDNGNLDTEPIESIPKDDSDSGFVFAGIDITDIASMGKYFTSIITTLLNWLGSFPDLFARIFSFLPSEITSMIYMTFIVVIICGFVKIFT